MSQGRIRINRCRMFRSEQNKIGWIQDFVYRFSKPGSSFLIRSLVHMRPRRCVWNFRDIIALWDAELMPVTSHQSTNALVEICQRPRFSEKSEIPDKNEAMDACKIVVRALDELRASKQMSS